MDIKTYKYRFRVILANIKENFLQTYRHQFRVISAKITN